MKFVSLFAGIGGLDLGLERAGHTCVGQVEIDDYATKVLEKHWPDVPRIRDVHDFHGTEFGPFDMLVGGYPCQPFSVAGSRKGQRDDRHLWPEVLRIVRAVRPRFLLVENVTGHLSLGFGEVLGDLAESGYDAEWDCIPAAAVGAPHRRDRVFLVAYSQSEPSYGGDDYAGIRLASKSTPKLGDGSGTENVANSNSSQREGGRVPSGVQPEDANASSACWWAVEPDVGRVAHGVPDRVDRLKTLGNAVVPQVAEFIGRRLPRSVVP